jgi:hypothetical protein
VRYDETLDRYDARSYARALSAYQHAGLTASDLHHDLGYVPCVLPILVLG